MRCFPELTYMMYADRELPADEARQVETHLAACPACRELASALAEENRVLPRALQEAASEAPAPVTRPSRAGLWSGRGWSRWLSPAS